MSKKTNVAYITPAVEFVAIHVEKGFAQSAGYGNAGEAGTAFGEDQDYGEF